MSEDLLTRMARALRTMPCRCDYERNAAGVPTWYPSEGGGIERKLIRTCAAHLLLKEYDDLPTDDGLGD